MGFIYQITQNQPVSFSFNNNIDTPEFNQMDVLGADWLVEHNYNQTVYADDGRYQIFAGLGLPFEYENLLNTNPYAMVYLGTYNTKNNKISVILYENSTIPKKSYIPLIDVIGNDSQLYDNGGI